MSVPTLSVSIPPWAARPCERNPASPSPSQPFPESSSSSSRLSAALGKRAVNSVPSRSDDVTVTAPPTCSSVAPQADLELIKTSNKTVVRPGESMTYTLTLTNKGPGSAPSVKVRDQIPAGLTFVSAAPSVGTYNSSTGIWDVGDLANGASATLTITVTVN